MVKILYDFDISKVNSSRYFDNDGQIGILTEKYTSNLLKNHDSIFAFQYLGGGYDTVCFIENVNHRCYAVEPANGLIIAYFLMTAMIEFEEKRSGENVEFTFPFELLMDETFFRPHRNDDEFLVLGDIKNYNDVTLVEITLKYPNSSFEWKCKYIDFVAELLRFGERMMHLYGTLLPDFKSFLWYTRLKKILLEDNILRQKYGYLIVVDNFGKSYMDSV